jgi:acyl carrier protein
VDDGDLLTQFRGMLHEEFSIDPDRVRLDSRLVDDLGLDSLDLVSASLAIEDRWGVRLEDEDLAGIATVGDAIDWVRPRLQQGAV